LNQFFCIDRFLPDVTSFNEGAQRIALLKAKIWQNGATIYVAAAQGASPAQRKKVQETFEEVSSICNLDFKWKPAGVQTAECRISFKQGEAWSMIGTDAARSPKGEANMNLGFGLNDNNPGTYRHEFGHFIGAIHEHQNPSGGIRWNKEAVIRSLSGPPNNWDRATIEHNMFEAYQKSQLNGSQFDPKSIMLYPIPPEWTLDGFSSQANSQFSELDKKWMRDQYPGRGGVDPVDPGTPPKMFTLPIADLGWFREKIGVPGETDTYVVKVKDGGFHRFETTGPTPVVLRLFGPDSTTAMIAQTNNVGTDLNALIMMALNPGTYYLHVTHAITTGTGEYSLRAARLAEGETLFGGAAGEALIRVTCPMHPGAEYLATRKESNG
jgi:hypothetical protein